MSVWQLVHAWTRARKDVLTCDDKAKLPELIIKLGKHENALYEHAVVRAHHPWCNDHNPLWPGLISECSMCASLYRDHPVRPGDTPDTLMARHFPDNRRVPDIEIVEPTEEERRAIFTGRKPSG